MIARPVEFFRIDMLLSDGTEACGFAESFAEAIYIASSVAQVSRPAPRIFEIDPVTHAELKERRWLS